MEIDDYKMAAIIRHYGTKVEGEDSYILAIPLRECCQVPKGSRVIACDTVQVTGIENPTMAYVTFVEDRGSSHTSFTGLPERTMLSVSIREG